MNIVEKLGISSGPWITSEPVEYGIDIRKDNKKYSWIASANYVTEGKKKTNANAQLIASAPEMLKALIEEYEFLQGIYDAGCIISGSKVNEKIKSILNNKKEAIEKACYPKKWDEIRKICNE